MEIPLSQESIHMPEEDIKCQTKVSDRARPGQVSSARFTPILVFLDSMESPLSQESIHMLKQNIKCQTEVLDRAHRVRSARLG